VQLQNKMNSEKTVMCLWQKQPYFIPQ